MSDYEVTITVTPQRIRLYERAAAVGLPQIVVSMYGDRIQKLIDDEREAIAQSLDKQADLAADDIDRQWAQEMAAAVRARGQS